MPDTLSLHLQLWKVVQNIQVVSFTVGFVSVVSTKDAIDIPSLRVLQEEMT